jgi:hypothetical protein
MCSSRRAKTGENVLVVRSSGDAQKTLPNYGRRGEEKVYMYKLSKFILAPG